MIKILKKKYKVKARVKKVVVCPKCKANNEFVSDNDLVLFCKKCGQSLGLNIFH
jgi:ribosomal protein L37AE/L43A